MHGPSLLEEMQLCYDWPDGTIECIDWEAHRQSTQTYHHRRTHFVKLCHELLPTGNVVCAYGAGYPDSCPLCKTSTMFFTVLMLLERNGKATLSRLFRIVAIP
jgi:hypothetical protein